MPVITRWKVPPYISNNIINLGNYKMECVIGNCNCIIGIFCVIIKRQRRKFMFEAKTLNKVSIFGICFLCSTLFQKWLEQIEVILNLINLSTNNSNQAFVLNFLSFTNSTRHFNFNWFYFIRLPFSYFRLSCMFCLLRLGVFI